MDGDFQAVAGGAAKEKAITLKVRALFPGSVSRFLMNSFFCVVGM